MSSGNSLSQFNLSVQGGTQGDSHKLCSQNGTLLIVEGVFSFVIGELNEIISEVAKNIKYSLIQRTNERRNVNLIGLMQYLNFARKYEATAVTVDISRLPGKNCLVREAQMRERDRDKAFMRRREINIQLFTLRRREYEDFERKTSDGLIHGKPQKIKPFLKKWYSYAISNKKKSSV
ncbi:uncharacterized protein TNCV_4640661 [Trichonephila clavipes]|nr:uncharacterized protein TNCV_4640661 [Trichonephila clavipes]